MTKAGPATLVLSGTNTYTGGATISAGTLQLGNGGTSGSVVGNIVDDGVLAISRSDLITLQGVISGTGSLMQLGPGTLVLAEGNTYTGYRHHNRRHPVDCGWGEPGCHEQSDVQRRQSAEHRQRDDLPAGDPRREWHDRQVVATPTPFRAYSVVRVR